MIITNEMNRLAEKAKQEKEAREEDSARTHTAEEITDIAGLNLEALGRIADLMSKPGPRGSFKEAGGAIKNFYDNSPRSNSNKLHTPVKLPGAPSTNIWYYRPEQDIVEVLDAIVKRHDPLVMRMGSKPLLDFIMAMSSLRGTSLADFLLASGMVNKRDLKKLNNLPLDGEALVMSMIQGIEVSVMGVPTQQDDSFGEANITWAERPRRASKT